MPSELKKRGQGHSTFLVDFPTNQLNIGETIDSDSVATQAISQPAFLTVGKPDSRRRDHAQAVPPPVEQLDHVFRRRRTQVHIIFPAWLAHELDQNSISRSR